MLMHAAVTDDTAAINAAISAGVRCAPGVCKGSTLSPATVYFPSGYVRICRAFSLVADDL